MPGLTAECELSYQSLHRGQTLYLQPIELAHMGYAGLQRFHHRSHLLPECIHAFCAGNHLKLRLE